MFSELERNLDQGPPPIFRDAPDRASALFHYTNLAGVLGIVESRELWATNIGCLNDVREFIEAIEKVDSIIVNRRNSCAAREKELLEQMINRLPRSAPPGVFVVSFSENGDLLSQWRAYCPNGGFAIGFEYNNLVDLARGNGFCLRKCVYDDVKKVKMIKDALDVVVSKYLNDNETIDACIDAFIAHITSVAPIFKHKAFIEEQEWRLFSSSIPLNDERIGVRATNTRLIPYTRFSLSGLPNGNIGCRYFVASPHGNIRLSMAGLMTLLAKNNIEWMLVSRSKVPYRTL